MCVTHWLLIVIDCAFRPLTSHAEFIVFKTTVPGTPDTATVKLHYYMIAMWSFSPAFQVLVAYEPCSMSSSGANFPIKLRLVMNPPVSSNLQELC